MPLFDNFISQAVHLQSYLGYLFLNICSIESKVKKQITANWLCAYFINSLLTVRPTLWPAIVLRIQLVINFQYKVDYVQFCFLEFLKILNSLKIINKRFDIQFASFNFFNKITIIIIVIMCVWLYEASRQERKIHLCVCVCVSGGRTETPSNACVEDKGYLSEVGSLCLPWALGIKFCIASAFLSQLSSLSCSFLFDISQLI